MAAPARLRGRRRAKEVERELDPFTIEEEVSHLTKIGSEPCPRTRSGARRKRGASAFEMLSSRESGRSGAGGGFSSADRAYTAGKHLPVEGPWCVEDMDSEAYVSQFSSDGSLLVAGFRGSRIRIYDVDKGWKVHKNISCRSMRWTVSDIALSPDQRYLAYSSLSPIVHIVNVQSAGRESDANVNEIHEGLEFCDDDEYSFGIFSVKFSKDGKEVVVGNNDSSIYVYDLGANKVSVRIRAHVADVNTVTFADESGNMLYSGSDDNLCKVWDRRCLVGEKPAGVLTGHLDGITCIDSRGDGRYLISNCKDQTIKLWDVRKMSATVKGRPPRLYDWDYRWMAFPTNARYCKHPNDQSLATYRGHSVLRTLIRCYFSPMHRLGVIRDCVLSPPELDFCCNQLRKVFVITAHQSRSWVYPILLPSCCCNQFRILTLVSYGSSHHGSNLGSHIYTHTHTHMGALQYELYEFWAAFVITVGCRRVSRWRTLMVCVSDWCVYMYASPLQLKGKDKKESLGL